jgi:hypothetical protein
MTFVTNPVKSIEDFFPTYLDLLKARDIESLGALYREDATLCSPQGLAGPIWAIGRKAIKEYFCSLPKTLQVIWESQPTESYNLHDDILAWRHCEFVAGFTESPEGLVREIHVEAFELLMWSSVEGWQYLVDQSRVLPSTSKSSSLA